jgi:hypothetical protein
VPRLFPQAGHQKLLTPRRVLTMKANRTGESRIPARHENLWTVVRYAISSNAAAARFVLIVLVLTAAAGLRAWL